MEAEQTTAQQTAATAPVVIKPGDDAVAVGLVDGSSFNLAVRIGNMLAASNIVPKAYQGNMPNCVVALNMASRIGADPLMVMQNLYVVHGNPSWSAQFLIACFNQCGRFSSLRYEFSGEENTDSWSCRAWALEKETGQRLDGTVVSIGMAKKEGWYEKSGSKWKTMPQQMLMYRAASWFVRAYAPEIAMGLQTAEEMRDTYDAERGEDGSYGVPADATGGLNDALKGAAKPKADKSTGAPTDLIQCNRDECKVSLSKVCATCLDKGTCPEFKAAAK